MLVAVRTPGPPSMRRRGPSRRVAPNRACTSRWPR
jgi:hypothetical protein